MSKKQKGAELDAELEALEEEEIYAEVSLNYFMDKEFVSCPICGSLNTLRDSCNEIHCNDCEFDENY